METDAPLAPSRICPVKAQQHKELKTQLADLLDRGFMSPSGSAYGASVLFVWKKHGTMRMCIDFRGLNNISVRNSYPPPHINDLLDKLHGATIFSKLDGQMEYNQIRIADEDIPKTAFRTLFLYLVMPFGMCNAPATFQRTMNNINRQHHDDFVLVYLDDILIFSKSPAEHAEHHRQILTILRHHRFFCKESKCQLCRSRMGFLGHVREGGGILIDPAKQAAVRDWPTPCNATAVRSFMALVHYNRCSIPRLTHIALPDLGLTHKAVSLRNCAHVWHAKPTSVKISSLSASYTHCPYHASSGSRSA